MFRMISKRADVLTSSGINKLTRPRFGKRGVVNEDGQNDLLLPLSKLTRARFGKRNVLKRSTELFDVLRPRFGKRA